MTAFTRGRYRARVGYAKIGRSIPLDPARYGSQGDAEAPQLLERLARRNPDVEWVVIGKSNGENKMPPNVTNPWPRGVTKAPWVYSNGEHRCTFCKTQVPHGAVRFECCDNGRAASAVEDYITVQTTHLDGVVVQLGQHGASHQPIPAVKATRSGKETTDPYAWARNYGGYLIRALNTLGDASDGKVPVVWVCSDPRNYAKCRDLKWPTGLDGILAQYAFERDSLHERYGDTRSIESLGFGDQVKQKGTVWQSWDKYSHADVELCNLGDDWETWGQKGWAERAPIGVATTAYWPDNAGPQAWRFIHRRSALVRDWVWSAFPDAPVFGKWDAKSLADLEGTPFENAVQSNTVGEFPDLLGSWRCTVSLPPATRLQEDLYWTVAKPWQCFAARVVCFSVDPADAQGSILPARTQASGPVHQVGDGLWSVRDDWTENDMHLARWLRVKSSEELQKRVAAVSASEETWQWLVDSQRDLLRRRWEQQLLERTVEWKLGFGDEPTETRRRA